jgi:uncharacterized membrane protein YbhN (UPF0104 family)
VERVLDIFGLLTVLSLTLTFLPPELAENPVVKAFRTGGIVLVAVAVVVLVVGVVAASRGARVVVERLSRPAPARLRDRALGIYDQLAAGFEVVGQPLRILPALGITLVMWGNGLLAILCLFQAFSLDLGVVAGLFTQCGLGVIVALPQAPGYWGAFQVAVSTTMQAFGAGEGFAKASAILFWAVCFVPVTTIGLVEYWRFGRGLLRDDDAVGEPSAVAD